MAFMVFLLLAKRKTYFVCSDLSVRKKGTYVQTIDVESDERFNHKFSVKNTEFFLIESLFFSSVHSNLDARCGTTSGWKRWN
jgi:hypothetical protein